MNIVDPWLSLHREISRVLTSYDDHKVEIYVYKLLQLSIDIIVGRTGTFVHLKRNDIRSNGGSTIIITSNKFQGDLTVSADPEKGFVLKSGQALSVHEFCSWLFDLALELSESEFS
jgi:hypothetical protein